MLTSPQSIYGEIRARAVILKQARSAQSDAVVLSAGGLHPIVAVRTSIRPSENLGNGVLCPFLPGGNLLFEEHEELRSGGIAQDNTACTNFLEAIHFCGVRSKLDVVLVNLFHAKRVRLSIGM